MNNFFYNSHFFFRRGILTNIYTTLYSLPVWNSIGREKYSSENAIYQRYSSPLLCSTLVDKEQIILQGTEEHILPTLDDKGEYCGICIEDFSHLSDSKDSIKGSDYPMNQGILKIQPRDKHISLQGKEEKVFPSQDDKEEYCAICMEDYDPLSDFEDSSTSPSYPMYQGSLKIHPRDLMASSSFSLSTETSLKDKPKIEFVEVLKSLVDEDFTDGKTSLPLRSMEEDMELNKFLPARSNHLPRPVIPIGPRFQAKIPKWEGRTDIKQHDDDDDDDGLKWLGTQIWPIPIISETNTKDVGKARLKSCSFEDHNKIVL